jgi:hypothetical protein
MWAAPAVPPEPPVGPEPAKPPVPLVPTVTPLEAPCAALPGMLPPDVVAANVELPEVDPPVVAPPDVEPLVVAGPPSPLSAELETVPPHAPTAKNHKGNRLDLMARQTSKSRAGNGGTVAGERSRVLRSM